MLLNKDDCLVLRGLAISSIFLHNYCHLLPNASHENEFFFSEENNLYFWGHLFSTDFLIQLSSYLGHLGVPVFVFLTGYGLSIKYGQSKDRVDVITFIWNHYKKFFFPMLFGTILFILFYGIIHQSFWEGWPISFFSHLTLTINLVLHPDSFIKPGPYWYYGMTMQLYIIYRLLLYNRSNRYLLFLVLLSIIGFLLLESKHYSLIWFKYNAFGWLLPFAVGMLCANNATCYMIKDWYWVVVLVCSMLSILLLGFNYYLWLIIPVLTILFYISLSQLIKGYTYKIFHYLGSISMFVFVVHPIVREVVMNTFPGENKYVGIVVYVAVTIVCSFLVSRLPIILRLNK